MSDKVKGPGITSKAEIAKYLKIHDPDTLEFLKQVQKEFGDIETLAYVKPKYKSYTATHKHAAGMSDGMFQAKLDSVINQMNELDTEAKSRYGPRANLRLNQAGRIVVLSDSESAPFCSAARLVKFASAGTTDLTGTKES